MIQKTEVSRILRGKLRMLSHKQRSSSPAIDPNHAFTLIELIVTFAVLVLLLVVLLSMTSSVARVTASHAPTFQEARTAFETMARTLSQAVVNPYWDYDNPTVPQNYLRASELHFVLGKASSLLPSFQTAGSAVFFQAPLGKTKTASLHEVPSLLNSTGFYIRYSESEVLPDYLAPIKPATAAWRLWMYQQPAEEFSLYSLFNANPQGVSDFSWFQNDLHSAANHHVLANHVVLLLIRCAYENATGGLVEDYLYNSRPTTPAGNAQPVEMHQIPPTLYLTMVAIDQPTADRLAQAVNGIYDLIDMPPVGGEPAFTDAAQYTRDIAALQNHLNSRPVGDIPIHYHIFETTINVGASKWSR